MRSNLISYPTEHFSKLIYVTEILFHRPYEAVKIVIPILKNCLVNYNRFKRHILCFELKTVEKYDVLEEDFKAARDESCFVYLEEKGEHLKLYVAADVDASWEKVRRHGPSHNVNIINTLSKQKLKSQRINIFENIFERHVKLQSNSWHSWFLFSVFMC